MGSINNMLTENQKWARGGAGCAMRLITTMHQLDLYPDLPIPTKVLGYASSQALKRFGEQSHVDSKEYSIFGRAL